MASHVFEPRWWSPENVAVVTGGVYVALSQIQSDRLVFLFRGLSDLPQNAHQRKKYTTSASAKPLLLTQIDPHSSRILQPLISLQPTRGSALSVLAS